MPGNTVMINNADGMEWYVGDSKIDEVIEKLNRVGSKMDNGTPQGACRVCGLEKAEDDMGEVCVSCIQERRDHPEY